MRFLLHPVNVKSRVNASAGRQALTAVVNHQGGSSARASLPAPSPTSIPPPTLKPNAWGQQCSPNCGCVLRFEATTCSATNQIMNASYTAKRVLTDAHGCVQLTNRTKRPMMTDCNCDSLHYLAHAVVQEFLLNSTASKKVTWQYIKSQLEFDATRSSPAFAKSVLYAQNLPLTSTGCFDLVEEALTGMLKGYLPKQRRISQNDVSRIMSAEDDDDEAAQFKPANSHATLPESTTQQDYDFTMLTHHSYQQQQHDSADNFPFAFWKDEDKPTERQTMLEYVDEQQAKMVAAAKGRNGLGKQQHVPKDWVDYVDWLQQQEGGEYGTREGSGMVNQQQQSA
ncbi:hypothetical protein MPSEU_000403500 [Mayamaea pseudoterrestris]|nr:hypothetical protein MPSEU_000403500 [Mayamaea pseudoterrestris]